jgi:anthranilate synthase component 2/putative glutamine amidotransferase
VSGLVLPVIGVTTYAEPARWSVWDRPAAVLPLSYVDGIARCGGVPVLLPPLAAGAVEAVSRLDALVLAGGADVDPDRYGETPHPTTVTRPDRDAWELAVLAAALDRDLPVLAICRGMQLLNVAAGGTLHQHLPDTGGAASHQPSPGTFGATPVRVRPTGRLAGIIGRSTTVACHHHQSVRRLGDGLQPAAWADDETVEAIEASDHGFVVGVQWHPEENQTADPLFTALIAAATAAAAGQTRSREGSWSTT